MFLMFLTFVVMLAGMAVLIWLGCQRVALHLRGKPEATRAVVEHVLMPLFGRKEAVEFETGPDGMLRSSELSETDRKDAT